MFYSVAQYVHDRREERLNVGVAVYDSEQRSFSTRFYQHAADRVKRLYPEVDRAGLQLYLNDLARALPQDERVAAALKAGDDPLAVLQAEWGNVIRFTPTRSYPALNAAQAATELLGRFMGSVPSTPASGRDFGGIERARRRTAEAIESVLQLTPGLGVSAFHGKRSVLVGGRFMDIPIEFPFWLFEEFVIDTVSLEATGNKEPMRQADHFIQKVANLKKFSRDMDAHAAVAVDPQRRDQGLALIEYMRQETGLSDQEIRVAEEAEVVVSAIKEKRERHKAA